MNDPVLRGFLRGREARRVVEELRRFVQEEWKLYIKSTQLTNEATCEISVA